MKEGKSVTMTGLEEAAPASRERLSLICSVLLVAISTGKIRFSFGPNLSCHDRADDP